MDCAANLGDTPLIVLAMDGLNSSTVSLEVLDDLCLQHIASMSDSIQDLLNMASTSLRLYSAVKAADPAWQRHILTDFGLLVKGTGLKSQYDMLRYIALGKASPAAEDSLGVDGAAASGSAPRQPAGGAPPRANLAAPLGSVRPFLPFAGVSTDGGCDSPAADFWVGHLFTPSSRTFYSSEALTRNIHCVAVLQPDGYDQTDPHRAFLLDRLQLPAAYLSRDVMRCIMTDQAWEGGPSRDPPDPLPALPRSAVEEARRVLSQCATEVLEDLYAHCYNQMNQGRPWGGLLTRGLNPQLAARWQSGLQHQPHHDWADIQEHNQDAALHAIHQMAWKIWHNQRSVPFKIRQALPERQPRLLFGDPPLRPLLQARLQQLQRKGSGSGGAMPNPEPKLFRTLGLFDSVLLNRHLNVTCPLRCGALFAVVAGGSGDGRSGGGCEWTTPAAGRGGSEGGGGGFSAADADMEAAAGRLAARLTNGLAGMPCVQAFDDVSDIRAILAAVRAGTLPPISGYFTNGWLEWVEFERPTFEQALGSGTYTLLPEHDALNRVLNHDQSTGLKAGAPPQATMMVAATRASASSSDATALPLGSSGAKAAGEASQRCQQGQQAGVSSPDAGLACRVLPVLWFRFATREEWRTLRRRSPTAAPSGFAAAAAAGGPVAGGPAAADAVGPAASAIPEGGQAEVAPLGTAGGMPHSAAEAGQQGLPPSPLQQQQQQQQQQETAGGNVNIRPATITTADGQGNPDATLTATLKISATDAAAATGSGVNGDGDGMHIPRVNGSEVRRNSSVSQPAGSGVMGYVPEPLGPVPVPSPPPLGPEGPPVEAGLEGARDSEEASTNTSGDSESEGLFEFDEDGAQDWFNEEDEVDGDDEEDDEGWVPVHDEDGEEEVEEEDELALGQQGTAGQLTVALAGLSPAAIAATAAAACNAVLEEVEASIPATAVATESSPAAGSPGSSAGSHRRLMAQAVITPSVPIFPISPNLTALAPGVGYAYGWAAPSVSVGHMVPIRLKQPWCANALLAKLISCEDTRPVFNLSRGGCNIDAGIITVQGPAAAGGVGGGPLLQLLDSVSLL
ncbi:hypothetical protein VaNZ11_009440 [Volvox africanus]|uniref:Uncharacterized protein n=1 Tax=Volvox africanus TaxID=51714 RepID=A0ABQ5S7D4_9CHLO|nr:hypothetical protein VaNZ11_009440 [Volvox africanus]